MPGLLRDIVGNFGWLDAPAPFAAWFPWLCALAIFVAVALTKAPRRVKLAAGASLAAACAVILGALTQSYRLFHFPALQTRHYLPFAYGLVVLLAVARPLPLGRRARRWVIVGWASAHALCLAHTARRYLYGLANPAQPIDAGLVAWQPPVQVWLMVAFGALSAVVIAVNLGFWLGSAHVAEDVDDHIA